MSERFPFLESCPDCGSKRFQQGPSAGLSYNVRCENGHILGVDPFEVVVRGFQERGTAGVYGEPSAFEKAFDDEGLG